MKSENFIYWLQGYLELSDIDEITPLQLIKIKQHLKLVSVIEHGFIYWLQGYLLDKQKLTSLQRIKVAQEINTVLVHVSDEISIDEVDEDLKDEVKAVKSIPILERIFRPNVPNTQKLCNPNDNTALFC